MATVKERWNINELVNVMSQFDTQKVYRSTTGEDGVYSEVTSPSTRIDFVASIASYYYDDLTGDDAYFYKVTYYNTATTNESTTSAPISGDSAQDPALAIISVDELKEIYLFGLDLTNDQGIEYPDTLYEHYISSAVASLEVKLDIPILERVYTEEEYDYYREDARHFMFVFLKEYPVKSIEEMKIVFPSNNEILVIPSEDIHLRRDSGQVQVLPTVGSSYVYAFNNFPIGNLPYFTSGIRNLPAYYRISYTVGLDPVPSNIKDIVGKIASFGPLNIAGDLLGGAGIASQTISMDGLSQTFNTTSSATNAGYGARLLNYQRELKDVIPELRRYYKGIRLVAV